MYPCIPLLFTNMLLALTRCGTAPGLCVLMDLIVPTTSICPSAFICSIRDQMAMNVPVRPRPSLESRDIHVQGETGKHTSWQTSCDAVQTVVEDDESREVQIMLC